MPKTMLIDAYHPEETRVAVLQGGKVEDFDFEYASRKPLRGNIYLARVTRVEPSLQAAFIEYGGNRHGFLAFGEIHPDYYQIPVADRDILRKAEALEVELAQKLAELNQNDDEDDAFDLDDDDDELGGHDAVEVAADIDDEDEDDSGKHTADDSDEPADDAVTAASDDHDDETDTNDALDFVSSLETGDDTDWHGTNEGLIDAITIEEKRGARTSKASDAEEEEEEEEDRHGDDDEAQALSADDDAVHSDIEAADDAADEGEAPSSKASDDDDSFEAEGSDGREAEGSADDDQHSEARADDDTRAVPARREPSEDELAARARQKEIDQLRARYEDAKRERNRLLRAYKIQEVIKRRQIMLVQVVKEERGNKGAALTTYLSLAGRYSVLMPNTARGGGISRKITSQSDRKRLKKAMSDIEIAPNMGLIIRTAGAKRSKVEIRRDYDYLNRLWQQIRDRTLESVAPSLIYEEANLMKRAIRDLYDKDTELVIVQGEDGYREAKDFMKMLMPSHAKFVQQQKSGIPLFQKFKVEEQLDGMYHPVVQLKSGGYIVIQQTEALVSIDVNSGKSTKERNVEQTALKTNSEAAIEVARQCRLRDLAGLIVIDFIDMEENRNNRSVEKKLKDAMKNDRARTQIGSISSFGLLELSRQRRRSGIVDGTTQACPVCEGAGHVRSHEMAALRILRAAEGEAGNGRHGLVAVKTSTEVALYILNTKRSWLDRMEKLYGVKTNIIADSSKYADQYEVTGSGLPNEAMSLKDAIGDDGPLSDLNAPELPGETSTPRPAPASSVPTAPASSSSSPVADDEDGDGKPKRRRRRRRRKGSGEDRAEDQDQTASDEDSDDTDDDEEFGADQTADSGETEADAEDSSAEDGDLDADGKPKRRRRRGRRGGRRNRRTSDSLDENGQDGDHEEGAAESVSRDDDATDAEPSADEADEASAAIAARAPETADGDDATVAVTPAQTEERAATPDVPAEAEAKTVKPRARRKAVRKVEDQPDAPSEPEPQPMAATEAPSSPPEQEEPKGPRRVGWWQRPFQKS